MTNKYYLPLIYREIALDLQLRNILLLIIGI